MGCIYGIRNELNQKWYIGKSHRDVINRKNDHFSGHGNRLLKRSINKYGVDNFTFHILHDGILDIFLDDYEIQTIKKYNSLAPNGFNLTGGGEGGILSEETRRKMSEAHKGSNNHNYGKRFSAEHRRNLSVAHRQPDYLDVKNVYATLPSEMKISKKRAFLSRNFPDINKHTLYRWTRKWQSES